MMLNQEFQAKEGEICTSIFQLNFDFQGLNPSKPLFMDRKKKVVKESSSESDSDEEWGQSRKRKRKAVTCKLLVRNSKNVF